MDNSLVPTRRLYPARLDRQAAKEIARARAASSVLAGREAAKIEAIVEVGQTALVSGAEVTALAQLLVTRTPAFASHAVYISDRVAMAMGNVVAQLGRRL